MTLNRPVFINATIPPNWLFQINLNVTELSIVGGNLKYIEADSFMSRFAKNIRVLVLEDIALEQFKADAFVGLSNLIELDIKDCTIRNIHRNALRAVDETLESLYIRSSGYWNPANLTGSSDLQRLTKVDFSLNAFRSVLGRESFRQLVNCEELRLSSSQIIAIGMNAFDFMVNLKRLYLNNNFLTSLPIGIFDRITVLANPPKPAIDLQDNFWRCDCYIEHLRKLLVDGYLMVDPMCYLPYNLRGRTFSTFSTLCCTNNVCPDNDNKNISENDLSGEIRKGEHYKQYMYIDGSCSTRKYDIQNSKNKYQCITNRAHYLESNTLKNISKEAKHQSGYIEPTFAMENSAISLVELRTRLNFGFDLLWFQSMCLTEVYCISSMPNYLRIYNVNRNATYTFCIIERATGILSVDKCLSYNPTITLQSFRNIYSTIVIYITTILFSIVLGATCLYTVIRKNPSLLRGSKRILLVKHKAVDALVLPSRVTLRNEIYEDVPIPARTTALAPVVRRNSIKSNAPSYISALQPTEAQLAEWRLRYHFNNDQNTTNQPLSLETGIVSYIYDGDSLFYSLDSGNKKIKDEYFKP